MGVTPLPGLGRCYVRRTSPRAWIHGETPSIQELPKGKPRQPLNNWADRFLCRAFRLIPRRASRWGLCYRENFQSPPFRGKLFVGASAHLVLWQFQYLGTPAKKISRGAVVSFRVYRFGLQPYNPFGATVGVADVFGHCRGQLFFFGHDSYSGPLLGGTRAFYGMTWQGEVSGLWESADFERFTKLRSKANQMRAILQKCAKPHRNPATAMNPFTAGAQAITKHNCSDLALPTDFWPICFGRDQGRA